MAFQVSNNQENATQRTGFKGDPVWGDSLREALESNPPPDGSIVFLEDRQDTTVVLEGHTRRHRVESSRTCGVALQELGGRTRFRADPQLADIAGLIASEGVVGADGPDGAERNRPGPGEGPPAGDAGRILDLLVGATSKLQSSAEIQARWVGFDQQVHLARPGGIVTAERRKGRRVWIRADMARSGRASHAVGEAALRSDDAEVVLPILERLAEEVATRVEARLGADVLPSAERGVVFAPGVGGVLIHELVGHALEADTVLGGGSWLGRSFTGSGELRVLDDPRRGRAAWQLDDEGESARATPLMREGRAVGWLHDRATARESGQKPTGHGRRASFRESVRPRMGCTFLAAGRSEPGDAIRDLDTGIYVRRMEAASTDTRTGRAVFRVTDADRIQNGRLVAPLAPHLICVDARAALGSVECVAADLAFDVCIGSCLHHGQSLAVSVGSPTFRIGPTSVIF
jgi:TldD protein